MYGRKIPAGLPFTKNGDSPLLLNRVFIWRENCCKIGSWQNWRFKTPQDFISSNGTLNTKNHPNIAGLLKIRGFGNDIPINAQTANSTVTIFGEQLIYRCRLNIFEEII